MTPEAGTPEAGTPPVGAVIVNYNAGRHLSACVASLRAEGVSAVVVADNESSDDSAGALAAADPAARVVPMGANLGYGTAVNRVIPLLAAPYVLVMNPDVVVGTGAVSTLAAALDADPTLGAVGPRIDNLDGTRYPSARRFPDLPVAAGHAFLGFVWPDNPYSRRYTMADVDLGQPSTVDWISGACLLVRREAFTAIGGFDERYFMYAEDVDLCWRMWRSEWRVGYAPAASVTHTVGVSADQAPYRMIVAHHSSLWRFARSTTTGARRALLPAVGTGLVVRTGLALTQRAWEGRQAGGGAVAVRRTGRSRAQRMAGASGTLLLDGHRVAGPRP